jgi:6-phospho-beta-glucosidase
MQIRVGGLAARIRDEHIPMELGMVGNETTGAGGFICGLRTVTAALEIAGEIEALAPKAWVMNLSNPAGIVTEAILRHTRVNAVGFCNIPINTQYDFAELFRVAPEKIRMDYLGLNHLSWVRGVYIDGKEVLQPLIAKAHSRKTKLYQHGIVDRIIDPEWLQAIKMVPRWYNRYFYYPDKTFKEDKRNLRSKGEEDILREDELRQIYASEGYTAEARRILESKGGAQYYLPVLQMIESVMLDRGDIIIADVPNGCATPDLGPGALIEAPVRAYREKLEPLPIGPLPVEVRGLVQAVKTYEELTIQAAVNGDRGAALAALATNPLVGSVPKAKAFLEKALEEERAYLPQFF